MSAKTKIVVLHMKELIYTGIFAALGILFIILMIIMFLPDKNDSSQTRPDTTQPTETVPAESAPDTTPDDSSSVQTAASAGAYIPGIYTTELILGGNAVDVEVIVSQEAISSIRLVNPSESVTTMYPLLVPTMESIRDQIYETQSISDVTYTADSKYTSLVLLEAIRNSLEKAQIGTTD